MVSANNRKNSADASLPITLSDAGAGWGSRITRPAQKAPSLAGVSGAGRPSKARINRGPCTNASLAG